MTHYLSIPWYYFLLFIAPCHNNMSYYQFVQVWDLTLIYTHVYFLILESVVFIPAFFYWFLSFCLYRFMRLCQIGRRIGGFGDCIFLRFIWSLCIWGIFVFRFRGWGWIWEVVGGIVWFFSLDGCRPWWFWRLISYYLSVLFYKNDLFILGL